MIKIPYLVCVVVVVVCVGCGVKSPLPPIVTLPLKGGTGIDTPFSDSSGQLVYLSTSSRGFEAKVTVTRLERSHQYVLSLEGKRGKPGNDGLQIVGEDQAGIGVLDMWIEATDPNGCWSGEFPSVSLPAGRYHVKFLVKDPAPSPWISVLVNDNVRFTVKEQPTSAPVRTDADRN